MSFVHLHTHTAYSHDGIGSPLQALKAAQSVGQNALALTEHGNMLSLVELEKAASTLDIKPLFGCEIYYQPTFQKDIKADKANNILARRAARYHLTVLAQSQEGYTNLSQMLTHANVHQYYYFPVCTYVDLVTYKSGLIVLSGCLSSFLSKSILALDDYSAQAYIQDMLNTFGRNFYLELQPFEVPTGEGEMVGMQEYVNSELLRYADKYGIPLVQTADAHYPAQAMYDSFLVGHAMKKHRDPIADYQQRYLHSEQAMSEAWAFMMGCNGDYFLEETQRLADTCNVTLAAPVTMPDIAWAYHKPDVTYRALCEGKLAHFIRTRMLTDAQAALYISRLEEELMSFSDKGFSSYMLLCAEIADYCKCHGIEMAARGSVCGSLCAYLTNVSKIDPVVHGTIFDRFFSRERTTIPDVDFDIQDTRREEVIAHLEHLYPGCTAQIGNINRWKTRNLLNDLSKYYGFGSLCKETAILALESINFDEAPRRYEDLMQIPELREIEQNTPDVFKHFVLLHGSMASMGKHASGLAISSRPIASLLPLVYQPSTGKVSTAYTKDDVEYVGVLKVDLLGVSALTVIQEAEATAGIVFQEEYLVDTRVYDAFAKGNTTGNFQFSGRQARRMLWSGKPHTLGDIAALTALNRPVPLKEGSFEQFVKGRQGTNNTSAIHYQYTSETYGALIYQEQVMAICQGLAGLSRAQTDKVLKMLKKYQQDNPDLRDAFVTGCSEHGVSTKDADALWQSMRRYLFCKAHAMSYAYLSVRQMYVKVENPYAWTLALLRHETDTKKQMVYMSDAINNAPSKDKRVYFLPAHVNGGVNFEGCQDDLGRHYIRLGLSTIDGIGETVAQAIVQEQQLHGAYSSRDDIVQRLPKRILTTLRLDVLQTCGALDFDLDQRARVTLLNKEIASKCPYEG